MKRILSFQNWISEAQTFPEEWQELPEWKLLRLMGIHVIDSNPRTGTIILNNLDGGKKSKNLRLTAAGYVRSSKAGYIFQTKGENTIKELLKYVIDRFAKKAIPLIPEADLDSLIVKHPELLSYLYSTPQVREGIIRRTGIKDARTEIYVQHGITPQHVKWLDKCSNRNWDVDTSTGEINVEGNFKCQPSNRLGFRGLRFGVVKGSFICDAAGLTSLEGAPKEVNGDFICSNNKITSLVGAPSIVGGYFTCYGNELTTLEGAPKEINRDFICSYNKITSLVGAPSIVRGSFVCSNNKITSLVGAPKEVNGDFICSSNSLTSLQGSPSIVGGSFICEAARLTTLEGAPKEVKGDFICNSNFLQDLNGAPEEISGSFSCGMNPLETLLPFPKNIGYYFRCDGFNAVRSEDGWRWSEIISGKLKGSQINNMEVASKLLFPLITSEEIAKVIEDDISFTRFVPKDRYSQVAKILGYTEEELGAIAISGDMGLF